MLGQFANSLVELPAEIGDLTALAARVSAASQGGGFEQGNQGGGGGESRADAMLDKIRFGLQGGGKNARRNEHDHEPGVGSNCRQ
jgi:hypothetical protein